ncbi:hypothetical protein L1887_47979 [Cichorium endivia]|nr:hypothetical protein L1887_47979 [Cichorium endivia]
MRRLLRDKLQVGVIVLSAAIRVPLNASTILSSAQRRGCRAVQVKLRRFSGCEPILTSARSWGEASSSLLSRRHGTRVKPDESGLLVGRATTTGAPFFASMSSMRLGSDLCYTICSPDAGSVIKTYSPDLIVNRILNPDVPFADVESEGYSKAVLTPNKAEFARLCTTLGVDAEQDPDTAAQKLANALKGPTILQKGGVDRITNGKVSCSSNLLYSSLGTRTDKDRLRWHLRREQAHVDAEGSLKRCGGQGDILAGCLGTFAGWAAIYSQEHSPRSTASSPGELAQDNLLLYAGYGAALTARACSSTSLRKAPPRHARPRPTRRGSAPRTKSCGTPSVIVDADFTLWIRS